jgi:ABC-type Na+ efflux pump permease subunit
MKNALKAIVIKDLRGITANRQLFAMILIVPIVLAVVLPSAFVLVSHFLPEEMGELGRLLDKIPGLAGLGQRELSLVINYLIPVFFLLIPVMASSVMAASAFVGEKEKQTLETLLYSPLSLKEIFRAKVLAAFALGMLVSALSFGLMLVVMELLIWLLKGVFVWPNLNWLVVLLLMAPALSLIAITLIVRLSAKAKSVMEAQQAGGFMVLPLVMLAAGQFTGVLVLSVWLLLALGLAAMALALFLLSRAMRRFSYEKLLQ